MGFLGFGKNKVVDLTEGYRQRPKPIQKQAINSNSYGSQENSGMDFFTAMSNTANNQSTSTNSFQPNSEYVDYSEGEDEKKKKLAKRILDMTGKIEELSNQVYHLQQRIELLERKSGIGGSSGY